ncbi:hypothetical protein [Pelagibacterium montanilacus]|uniref:hypothetical protein n=1 Tax=Pelagibacterium montanilacus TaxID=2185280 RepID=UPI000F8CA5F8|nr:hypothetical protein [Pelagibacterium montanilacus]
MTVEHVMIFALGFLAAGLLAVALGSAIWNRAVRLTKRRIAAVTPVTLNEFRADKDKLRAEFAITVRRLEMRADSLREKLMARIVESDAAKADLAALEAERDEQFAAITALKERESELVARIRDLEKDGAALAAMVRGEDAGAYLPRREEPDARDTISADQLSGDYRADVEDLLAALSFERQRNGFLEEQARLLLNRFEKKKKLSAKDEAIALLRDTLDARNDAKSEARIALRRAEARISNAESRLGALLSEAHGHEDDAEGQTEMAQHELRMLAEDLSIEDQTLLVKANAEAIEEAARRDWGTERFDQQGLRARLEALASDVSDLVYAADAEEKVVDISESLLDKVRRFADDDFETETSRAPAEMGSSVSERMSALRSMQAR